MWVVADMLPTKQDIAGSFDGRFPRVWYEKLQGENAAIAGLGGLGSHIAVMLARSGVGSLCLVDFDTVDVSNLNRQEYDVRHLGMKKTEALAQRLKEINPYIQLTTHTVRVTEENAPALFGGFRYVCEAFDRPEQKAMLINVLLCCCPHTTVISGNGMAGVEDANRIRTRKVMERLYLCGDDSAEVGAGMGLTAARVSVCAGHQANQTLRLMLGLD